MHRTARTLAVAVACALVVAACTTETSAEPSGTTGSGTSPVTDDATVDTEPSADTAPDTEPPGTTAPDAETTEVPTTLAPAGPLEVELPTGSITADADDAFVVTPGGVLYWHLDLLGAIPGDPVRIAGTAADNDIESVAGVVDGAIVLGLCCAAPEGQVSATTGEAAAALTRGWRAAFDPEGRTLVTVGDRDISVVDLETGDGLVQELPADASLVPLDVVWSGDSPIVLADDDGELALVPLDPATLALGAPAPIGLDHDEETYAEFAGLGPDGEAAVVHAAGDDAEVGLQAYDVETLAPVDTLTRTLPVGVRSVRVRPAGDVIWVDDGTVWRTVGGESVALGGGAAAVWFAAQ